MKIVGLKHQTGTFKNESGNSFNYDNWKVYCLEDISSNGIGKSAFSFSMKKDDLEKQLVSLGFKNANDVIGADITPVYNRYGKCSGFYLTGK